MWKLLEELKQEPLTRPRRLARETRARLKSLKDRGELRWWRLETSALGRVRDALHAAPEVPVVGAVAGRAEQLVQGRLDSLTSVSIADYDALNAKDAARAARDLRRRVDLLNLRHYEEANKRRKTVFDAIDETLARLGRLETAAP